MITIKSDKNYSISEVEELYKILSMECIYLENTGLAKQYKHLFNDLILVCKHIEDTIEKRNKDDK